MRIGIFGGTFDPVHLAHLLIAEQAREQAKLDQVWFIPSARPPHKLAVPVTAFDRRAEMLQLAVAGHKSFQVNLLEKSRPGPSFTVDTLRDLRVKYPGDEFCLILGGDCLPDLPVWREPAAIIELATLLVAARPGWPLWTPEQLALALAIPVSAIRMEQIEVPLLEIASRDLRLRAQAGLSLAFMVPRAVEVLIREKKIYV